VLLAKQMHDQGMSLRKISAELAARGYITAGGKPYVASAVQMMLGERTPGRGSERSPARRSRAVSRTLNRSVFVELVGLSHRAARTLNERGVKTATGKPWSPVTVTRVRQRLDLI
jgi:hypothetical protein